MFRLVPLLASAVLLGFLCLWATRTFPALAKRRRAVLIGLVVFLAADLGIHQMVVHLHVGGPLQTVFSVLVMAASIASIPIAVLHAVGWIAARMARRPKSPPVAEPTAMSRRQVVEAVGGAAFLGATGSMLGWGMMRGRHASKWTSCRCASPPCRGRSTGTSLRR